MARVAVRPLAVGLSVLALTGGHAAWEATAKTVTVVVDGQARHVRTHGSTVKDVLSAAGLRVGSHDLLAPATDIQLTPTTSIVLRHGRLMSLTVDGHRRDVWVTAMSVSEALGQIGVRADGAVLSADRTRAIPLKGFALEVRTRKTVQLLDGGTVRRVASNGLTVQDLLTEQHVALKGSDSLSPAPTAPLVTGGVVRITRVVGRQLVDTVPVPFSVKRKPNSRMWQGDTRVISPGRVGVLRRTFALTYVNGKLSTKRLLTTVQTAAPVTEVLEYGTRVNPYYVAGTEGLNFAALADCESHGNPRAVSRGGKYRGMYQFTLGTWHGLGGHGDPIDHSAAEQTYRAKLLYKRSGRSPWPVCGRYL
jgi:uncharacterized protein YabE (DUF348 family)